MQKTFKFLPKSMALASIFMHLEKVFVERTPQTTQPDKRCKFGGVPRYYFTSFTFFVLMMQYFQKKKKLGGLMFSSEIKHNLFSTPLLNDT